MKIDIFLQGDKKSPSFFFIRFIFLSLFLMSTCFLSPQNIHGDNIKQETTIDSNNVINKENVIQPKLSNNLKQPEFVKGLYLTAYKVASKEFYPILEQAVEAGINTVVFDLKNMNGDVFFSARQNELLTPENRKPIINIKKVVSALHGRNLRAVSRVVMFHDKYNAERDTTLRAYNPNGTVWQESERRGPCWLDSSHPSVQNYLLELIEQIAQSGVDEIQLDYVRFPTQGNSKNAIFHFQREDQKYAQYDSTYISRDRDEIILDFVKNAKAICKSYNVSLAADVFAIVAWQRTADIKSTGQNIDYLSEYLDNIHPMIYSSHFADDFGYRDNVPNEAYFLIYKGTKLASKHINSNCRVIPYIQANSWKVNFKKEYMLAQIQAIEDIEAGGYILWNSSNRYKKTLTWIQNSD